MIITLTTYSRTLKKTIIISHIIVIEEGLKFTSFNQNAGKRSPCTELVEPSKKEKNYSPKYELAHFNKVIT